MPFRCQVLHPIVPTTPLPLPSFIPPRPPLSPCCRFLVHRIVARAHTEFHGPYFGSSQVTCAARSVFCLGVTFSALRAHAVYAQVSPRRSLSHDIVLRPSSRSHPMDPECLFRPRSHTDCLMRCPFLDVVCTTAAVSFTALPFRGALFPVPHGRLPSICSKLRKFAANSASCFVASAHRGASRPTCASTEYLFGTLQVRSELRFSLHRFSAPWRSYPMQWFIMLVTTVQPFRFDRCLR
ncbi:hypothetical protein DFH06DRAFT_129279 [Mycena polygramma]|nr:hypothetical protein DFH06DRAFT_129279 [Mycena polygramma]